MGKRKPLPIELLHKLLICDPIAGKLYWRKRGVSFFASVKSWKTWNTRFAGKEALTRINAYGYHTGGRIDAPYNIGYKIAVFTQMG